MAADDDRGQAPDPWDEIVADGLGDGGEISFNFDEAPDAAPPGAEDVVEAAAGEPAAPDAAEPSAAAEDALVEHWLTGGDGETDAAAEPQPSGSPADEHAAGSSGIEIGTGGSGIAIHGLPEQEEIGTGASGNDSSSDPAAIGWPGIDTSAGGIDGEESTDGGFPDLASAAPAAKAEGAGHGATTPIRRPAKRAKKSGGLGQMIGVVLGGATAIPITLAILIYGLGKDPFGVTKNVPEQVSFLLPAKFRPGYKKPAAPKPDAAGPSALDDLPTVTEPAEPAVEPPSVDPVDAAGEPEMPSDPAAPPVTDIAALDAPSLDSLDALDVKPAPVAPPEPPPLDTAALDEAVGEAAALCEALGAVDDKGNRAYNKLRIRWYRSLARVAEELVAVENSAAISGRPLAGAPENVAALHGTIGGRQALVSELAALAPDWLAFANRGSDGVVVPATFESARRVGPYWAARVSLAAPGGTAREITVISRSEPTVVAGDVVVVTGIAIDDSVIWAADVRSSGDGLSAGF